MKVSSQANESGYSFARGPGYARAEKAAGRPAYPGETGRIHRAHHGRRLREAVERHVRDRRRQRLHTYGEQARRLGIKEEDVSRMDSGVLRRMVNRAPANRSDQSSSESRITLLGVPVRSELRAALT